MIVLLLGGSLFGFFGMLLSIPAVAAGSVLADDVLAWYRRTEWFRGGAAAAEESESLPSAD
jgi:predicted PurR-regulated permease PerM